VGHGKAWDEVEEPSGRQTKDYMRKKEEYEAGERNR